MDSIDIRVLKQMHAWRVAGEDVLWVTVLQTWGSSPRPIGSMMAISGSGQVIGSVSGGCIEDDLIREQAHYIEQGLQKEQRIQKQTPADQSAAGQDANKHSANAQNALGQNASGHGATGQDPAVQVEGAVPQRLTYGIKAEEAHRFGLPCGGVVELLLETNPSLKVLEALLTAITAGQTVVKTIQLETGQITVQPSPHEGSLEINGQEVRHYFGPQYRMLIIGAGQLSEYLATMAIFNGFEVRVCDPRAQYHGQWQVPQATLVTGMPDDEVLAFEPNSRSCIVALTHDPKLDDMALLEALLSPAFYVGAIGSRRNQAQRRQRLHEYFDIPAEALARLRGPVGIHIGSKTPAEIAVSIMADIIAVKNNVDLPESLSIEAAKNRAEATEATRAQA